MMASTTHGTPTRARLRTHAPTRALTHALHAPPRRYQLLGGLDRALCAHASFFWMYMALSSGGRLMGQHLGELVRPAWQGLPAPGSLPAVGLPRPALLQRLQRAARRKKKVSKKVPAYSAQQQQRQALAAAAGATAVGAEGAGALEGDVAGALEGLGGEGSVAGSSYEPMDVAPLELAPLEASTSGYGSSYGGYAAYGDNAQQGEEGGAYYSGGQYEGQDASAGEGAYAYAGSGAWEGGAEGAYEQGQDGQLYGQAVRGSESEAYAADAYGRGQGGGPVYAQ